MKLQMRTYDPRLQQDYSVPDYATQKTFSSLEHGLFVLDCVGPVDWVGQGSLLTECVESTSTKFFFMVNPWEPGARELRNTLEREFSSVMEFERSLCGYAMIGSDALNRLFQIRAMFGDGSTGQWCIGGCLAEFAPPTRTSFLNGQLWNLAHVLGQSEKLGCVLSLDEMQQSLLVTRLFDGFDDLLQHSQATLLQTL